MLPLGERPLLVRVGVHYKFSKLVVDRVEAVDGTYDVLFIGTGKVCAADVFFVCFFFKLKCHCQVSTSPHETACLPAADSGLVLKAIHLPREHGQSQEVTLEQLQVFQVQQKHKTITLHGVI